MTWSACTCKMSSQGILILGKIPKLPKATQRFDQFKMPSSVIEDNLVDLHFFLWITFRITSGPPELARQAASVLPVCVNAFVGL